MKDSLLAELLLTLTGDDRDELRLFVQSPYFNRGRDAAEILALLDVLSALIAEQAEETRWEKSRVFGAAYPGADWNRKKLEKRMSRLLQLLRQFLVERATAKDAESPEFRLALGEYYLRHGLGRRFESAMADVAGQLQDLPGRDQRYFELRTREAGLRHGHDALYHPRRTDIYLKRVLENLWLHYQAQKLKWSVGLLSYRQFEPNLEIPGSPPFDLATPLPAEITGRYPILYLLEAICEIMKKEAPLPAEIKQVQSALIRYKTEIPFEDRSYFALLLRNLCVRRNNESDRDFDRTLHDLNKEHLAEGYLFQASGRLLNRAFINIVITALWCEQGEWAEQFVGQYGDKILGETDTQDYYRLARAKLLAFRKQWDAALDALPGPFRGVSEMLIRNRLEIMALYETRSPLLHARLEAFKVQLSRVGPKVLSSVMKKRQTEFLNFVYQLLRARPGDLRRIQKIQDRMAAIPNLPEKAWLLEKAGALADTPAGKKRTGFG